MGAEAAAEENPALPESGAGEPVAEELLVEEVSIDGMCGVY
ncbi:mycofactocin precursor MftA [Streptomyces sp. NPDC045431]